ncbi:MAG: DNA polymerase III subunit alpha [Bacteroidota bacterium]
MYINCHTYYSLRYGTISEKELVTTALADNAKEVVLTDVNNTSACLNFVRLAQKSKLKPILGIDFRDGAKQLYLGVAKNNGGFHELNDFLSKHSHAKTALPEHAPSELKNAIFIYPFEQARLLNKTEFEENEYIGVGRFEINRLVVSDYSKYTDRLIALNSFTFRHKRDFNTHRLLRAIDNNILLSKLEKEDQANETDVYMPADKLKTYYKEHSYILSNTQHLLDACEIKFDFSKGRKHQNKRKYTDRRKEDEILITALCQMGLKYRYGNDITPDIRARLKKELDMIKQMDFVPFFLVNWDIIDYAKRKGYYHVGRGSGANSIVAYLLGITDVDPIHLDLYFERFMNSYRTSPPDFDIDFSWRDRDDVTRYIFERFGSNKQVALLATYNTFKHSAAVRELGKVFGLPKHEIDKLSKGKFDFQSLDKLSQLVIIYSKELEGRPNYLSIHAGGIIIAEKPIHYFTATDLPPKGFPTTQFDMVVAEDVGLYKYDILGQRGLGKIKDALQLVKINQPEAEDIDIHNPKPFFEDPKINRLVSQAKCIGCFYVESPAMRMLLRKLEVDNYHGLVAASSIIRPGVAKSGMMREYILRHKNPERRKQAHPVLQGIMPETYGIMVYQEDVIKVAHHFAGLDLGESDVLRRGMSGKYRSREEFDKVRYKFISNCREKGIPDQTIMEVWRQIESFAGYAFAKGHSASYAVESYQSLFLKTYYPLEYMVAVLNNGGGFYRSELYVHEARKLGGIIHAPCVNKSRYPTWLYGKNIYLGLHTLHSLESNTALRIIKERKENGEFKSFDDFLDRTPISIEQISILIRINAFRFTGVDKRTLLWKANFSLNKNPRTDDQPVLFKYTEKKSFDLPKFEVKELENAFDEIELLGYPLCHPFLLLKDSLPDKLLLSKDLVRYENKLITIYGYLVTIKNTTTSRKKRMQFGTFLDYSGDWIDTVHFPPVARQYPFRGNGIYKIQGKVVEEFNFYSVEVVSLERLAFLEDVRFAVREVGTIDD